MNVAPPLGADQVGAAPEPPEVRILPAVPEAPPTNNPVVMFGVVNTGAVRVLFVRVSVPVKVAKPPAVNAALVHVEPVQINKLLVDVFQYKAPVSKALPSLSTVGADALEPKYRSSNSSYVVAALVALAAAAVALVDALPALVEALDALVEALDAEVAAAEALAAADVALPNMPST